MRRTIRSAALAVAIFGAMPVGRARAQQSQPTGREAVVGAGETVHVFIDTNHTTAIYFAGPITELTQPPWSGLEITKRIEHVTVHPEFLPRDLDELGSFEVSTPAGAVTIALHAADADNKADHTVRVIPRDYRRWDDELEQRAGAICEKQLSRRADETRRLVSTIAANSAELSEWTLLGTAFTQHESVPIYDEPRRDEPPRVVLVRALGWERRGDHVLLAFEIVNPDDRPYEVASLGVLDEQGIDHAHRARLDHETSQLHGPLIGTVPPRSKVQGAVMVREPAGLGDTVTLLMSQPDSQRTIVSERVPAWARMHSNSPHTRGGHPEMNGRDLAVQLRLIGGAAWIDDGLEERDLLAATSMKGLGARLSYGLHPAIAFQVEVMGARSGDAQFSNIELNGERGELVRTASFGRVLFGTELRTGGRVSSAFRLGLGVQATSYDTRHAADGMTTPGPDAPLDVDMIVGFGGSVDARINAHVTVGMGISYIERVNADERTLELGAHVGYSWTRAGARRE